MEVTRSVESQLTLFQLQQFVVLDQPLGAGLRAARSLDMTAASSADVNDERVRKEKIMKVERQSEVLRLPILREIFCTDMKRGNWERSCGS